MLEQTLNFEQLVSQYESSSGNTYLGDLKAATILRSSPQRMREYLQLSLKEDSTYADIREAVLAYERVTKGFSAEQILKQVQAPGDPLQHLWKLTASTKAARSRRVKERKETQKEKDEVLLAVVFHGAMDVAKEKESSRKASQKERKEVARKDLVKAKESIKDKKVTLQEDAIFVVIHVIGL